MPCAISYTASRRNYFPSISVRIPWNICRALQKHISWPSWNGVSPHWIFINHCWFEHNVGTGIPDGPKPEEYVMARKRGKYQRRIERKNILAKIFGALVLLFIPIACVSWIISQTITLNHIQNDSIKEYTGTYTYEFVKRTGRFGDSYYVFTLGNGDVVTILKGECRNGDVLDSNPELTIQYDRFPFRDGYGILSIATSDGEVVIRSLTRTRNWCVINVCFLLVVGLISIAVLGFSIFAEYRLYDVKKRFQRWRKKRRKIREQIDTLK